MESDSDRGTASDDDDEPGFDPSQLENMSDKERKKWEKNLQKWRIFVDFLFRHITIATFKYNCFERDELAQFMAALDQAEKLRSQAKLKKGEEPRISSYKTMREGIDLLEKQNYLNEANRIKRFLDICGRMKGIGMIAGGFYKALKKGKVSNLDKIKYYLDYWKGFTVRSYDYTGLQMKNTNVDSLNDLERRFLPWPVSVRTTLNIAQKYLKKCSESTGLALVTDNQVTMQAHMQAAEMVLAARIEESLFDRVVKETKSFLNGGIDTSVLLGIKSPLAMRDKRRGDVRWELPRLEDIDPRLIRPIHNQGLLMELPAEPPKEKKGKKGGKKGKGKGKGGAPKKKKKKK